MGVAREGDMVTYPLFLFPIMHHMLHLMTNTVLNLLRKPVVCLMSARHYRRYPAMLMSLDRDMVSLAGAVNRDYVHDQVIKRNTRRPNLIKPGYFAIILLLPNISLTAGKGMYQALKLGGAAPELRSNTSVVSGEAPAWRPLSSAWAKKNGMQYLAGRNGSFVHAII